MNLLLTATLWICVPKAFLWGFVLLAACSFSSPCTVHHANCLYFTFGAVASLALSQYTCTVCANHWQCKWSFLNHAWRAQFTARRTHLATFDFSCFEAITTLFAALIVGLAYGNLCIVYRAWSGCWIWISQCKIRK